MWSQAPHSHSPSLIHSLSPSLPFSLSLFSLSPSLFLSHTHSDLTVGKPALTTTYTYIHWGWYVQENYPHLPRYKGQTQFHNKVSTSICVYSSHTPTSIPKVCLDLSCPLLGLPDATWKGAAPVLAAIGSPIRKQVLSWSSAVPRASSKAGHAKAETVTTVGNLHQQPMGATERSLE